MIAMILDLTRERKEESMQFILCTTDSAS